MRQPTAGRLGRQVERSRLKRVKPDIGPATSAASSQDGRRGAVTILPPAMSLLIANAWIFLIFTVGNKPVGGEPVAATQNRPSQSNGLWLHLCAAAMMALPASSNGAASATAKLFFVSGGTQIRSLKLFGRPARTSPCSFGAPAALPAEKGELK